jgi:hypothetical protein
MQFMPAVESEGLRAGELLRLTGPAIPLDKISANGRKYIAESVHMQVAELQPRIQKRALFGCLDHPPTKDLSELAYVKMTDVSHRIDALWYDEATKTYMITVTILDTPNGRILKAIHDSGSPLYVSLRSLLDPGRNVQRNGYIDAWMLALITVDFVSRPGFADAELQAVDVSNECALAVCESLNLFSQHKRNFDMKTNKRQAAYIPLIALEGITGIATEPSKDFVAVVNEFIGDIRTKFPEKFTASDFATTYPDSLFKGHVVCLYEDTKELMIQDENMKVVAIISLDSEVDGEYKLAAEPTIEYLDTEVSAQSDPVQRGNEMYPVITTEDYTPDTAFMETANNVADYMRQNYHEGFTQDEFNTEIAGALHDQFQVDARIDATEDQELELKFVGNNGSDGASILLTLDGDKMIPGQLSEYWMPGTEGFEVGQVIKLMDAEGECIAEGTCNAVGTFGELRDTIESEDETGYANMVNADISDDTQVVCIDGNWYYIEDNMSVECDEQEPEHEPATESYPVKLKAPVCVNGTIIPAGEQLMFDAHGMAAFENKQISIYDFPTAAIETITEQQQTDGNQNPAQKIDPNYMKQGDLKDGAELQAEIVDDNDDDIIAQKRKVDEQMYAIIEEGEATVIEDEDEEEARRKAEEEEEARRKAEAEKEGKGDDDTDEGDGDPNFDDHNYNELAEEAQKIFNLPNSKFAGNYAIEHMPAVYKHIWNGLTDGAKAVIAKQAEKAQIACEADCNKFWSKTDFIAVERAVITGKGKVEAALENMKVVDPRVAFIMGYKQ